MVLIFLHLRHGLSSALQSLGVNHPRYNTFILMAGTVLAVLIGVGFAVIPIWAYLRWGQVMTLEPRSPGGPIETKWDRHKFESKLVEPGQPAQVHGHRRRARAWPAASAAASLGRAGLQRAQLLHPRQPAARAQHRRAGRHQRREELPERRRQRLPAVLRHGQGRRLPRARGQRATGWRSCRSNIIDQCVAQGVPFAREYGGLLDNRSFGGAQVSRTFYARGQTGQQLLLGAYQSLMRQVERGHGHAATRSARCSTSS